MILIVGGYAAGKRAYARDVLGYRDEDMSRDVRSPAPVLYGLEDAPDTPLAYLLRKDVVICQEVGAGLVPVDAGERARREAVGRLCIALSREADRVVRVVCGVGMVIKG